MLADGETLYEVGLGIIKCYKLAYVIDCNNPVDSKTVSKQEPELPQA